MKESINNIYMKKPPPPPPPLIDRILVGDVVKLKSGGPKMTVKGRVKYSLLDAAILGTGVEYVCEWFDGNQRLSGSFNERELKRHL
jgi:uncharacterized protein YodC (DUF2158 family)